jgi:hypothetical protein
MKFTKKNTLYICLFLFAILLIIFYFIHYKTTSENFENGPEDMGFIITRHVNNESANKIWLSCVTNIRKYYPDVLIVIIDDDSNYDFIHYPDNFLKRCIVIDSEFKKSGELLPCYYFYHNHWFQKAIYIHDSVFINGPIDISNVENVKFLWEFESTLIYDERPYIEEYLGYLNHGNELMELFNSNSWVGCYGVMYVIDHSYIKKIVDKYNVFVLLDHVKSRIGRMAMERIFALLCFFDKGITAKNASIFGNYSTMQGGNKYNYDTYFEDLDKGLIGKNPIKLYFGR